MDITPHPNLLKSLRGERTDYVLLIGEGVDNAFDAGADVIHVNFGDDEISFRDNGKGITRDRLSALFSLGEHGPMTTTQLGRFGIGIKSQAVNCGNILTVESISHDGRVRAQADWRDVVTNGRWEIDDPRWMPSVVGAETGTTISITSLRIQPRISVEKVNHDLALRFHPALVEGYQITLNGSPVLMVDEPEMDDIVAVSIPLSQGRSAHLRAGTLKRPSKLHHVHVAYKHRVIMPESSIGCGEYGGLSKLFARLRLSGPWHLAKFKNDLTDEKERAELEDAVFEHLRPLLEKVNTASLDARVHAMSQLVNDRIPSEIASRPKPQKKDKKAGDREKRKAQENGKVAANKSTPSDTGPARTTGLPSNRLLITFDGISEDDGIGAFAPGRPHRVNLSKDDPHIAKLLQSRDLEFAADTLLLIALTLFERGREEHQIQFELPIDGSFGKRVSNLLANQEVPQAQKARKS